MRILNRLAQVFRQQPPAQPPTVRVTQEGLEVTRGDDVLASVRWSEVRKIIAYKYHLFSFDEICVGFLMDARADSWLEISEEWSGFGYATEAMRARFTSIPEDWLQEVMFPAFDREETVLWEDG